MRLLLLTVFLASIAGMGCKPGEETSAAAKKSSGVAPTGASLSIGPGNATADERVGSKLRAH